MKRLFKIILAATLLIPLAISVYAKEKISESAEEYIDEYFRLYYTGRYKAAADIAEEAYYSIKDTFGPDHPNVAVSFNNLGTLYKIQRDYSKAESLYKRAYEIYKRNFGSENLYTVGVLINLGEIYQIQRKFKKAEDCYNEAESALGKALGQEHQELAKVVNNLGSIYKEQLKYEQAELFYQRSLNITANTLGFGHPNILKALTDLGLLYQAQKKYQEAEAAFKQAWDIFMADFTQSKTDAEGALRNLDSQRKESLRKDNEPIYKRTADLNNMYLSPYHPEVARFLNYLPALYYSQKRFTEAGLLYESELELMVNNLGSDHPNVAKLLDDMAKFFNNTGKKDLAESLQKRAEKIRAKKSQ